MDFSKLHHVAIICSDYQKAYDFYVKTLGFAVVRDTIRPDKNDRKIDLKFGEAELELFIMANAPARPNYPEAQGLRHLAFAVDEIEPVVAALAAKGIECEPIRVDPLTDRKMTFFHDPDGLPLELHE